MRNSSTTIALPALRTLWSVTVFKKLLQLRLIAVLIEMQFFAYFTVPDAVRNSTASLVKLNLAKCSAHQF